MNTVQAQWDSYEKRIVPASAGLVQRQESKRAFYAGAAGVLGILDAIGAQKNEATAQQMLDLVQQEVRAFGARVRLGHE